MLALGTAASGLAQSPRAKADPVLVAAVEAPGQAPNIISRAQWGADESIRSRAPMYDNGIKAGVVHHSAGVNDYAQQDSAAMVRAIYTYHTRTLAWSASRTTRWSTSTARSSRADSAVSRERFRAHTLAGSTGTHGQCA